MTEKITIEVKLRDIIVHDGQMKGSRLKYQAPGLEIFVIGAVSKPLRDKVHYHAMNAALCRHIPLISLKAYGWV